MNCDDYLRTQDIPACWQEAKTITGITVPVNATAVFIYFRNLATGLINILTATTGAAGEVTIEMDDVAPLYNHFYEITVLSSPDRVPYQLTVNSETGCAVRFKVYESFASQADSLTLTTDSCLTS